VGGGGEGVRGGGVGRRRRELGVSRMEWRREGGGGRGGEGRVGGGGVGERGSGEEGSVWRGGGIGVDGKREGAGECGVEKGVAGRKVDRDWVSGVAGRE